MSSSNLSIGNKGEEIAINYLKDKGYSILHHHFTTHWGELDIIAQKESKLYFIEVKTRVGTLHGKPYEAVGYHKIQALKRAIQYFLMRYNFKNAKCSLDVISIILFPDLTVESIHYYENAYR